MTYFFTYESYSTDWYNFSSDFFYFIIFIIFIIFYYYYNIILYYYIRWLPTFFFFFSSAADMLLRRLFSSSGPKFYFGNSDWYAEWLGTIDNWYPAYHLDLRTHPFSNPLPPGVCHLAAWTEDGQVILKNVCFWALILQKLFWEATKWSVLPGFGLAFAFVNR
jgi:hypothetical protein